MAEVRITDDILTWDLEAMSNCREKINACLSSLISASDSISKIESPSGAEFYSAIIETIVASIDSVGETLINVKGGLVTKELALENADYLSEQLLNEIFNLFFIEEMSLEDSIGNIEEFYQNDYYHVKYGSGNVGNGGCCITTFKYLYEHLTGIELSIEELAKNYGKYYHLGQGSGNGIFEELSEDFGVSITAVTRDQVRLNPEIVDEAIERGAVIEVQINTNTHGNKSIFTKGGHYIGIYGKTEDGKYLVYDPNGMNHIDSKYATDFAKNPKLIDGFKNGFEMKDINVPGTSMYIIEINESSPIAIQTVNKLKNRI